MENKSGLLIYAWKKKAIERQIENKNARKRLKEAKLSRNQWKQKAIERNNQIKTLETEIQVIKKNLEKIVKKI